MSAISSRRRFHASAPAAMKNTATSQYPIQCPMSSSTARPTAPAATNA